jgi:hypothetical protein
MKRYAVTVYVQADDTADAVLAAGDILLDTGAVVPGPNYGLRHGAELLAALGDSVIQVCEMTQ